MSEVKPVNLKYSCNSGFEHDFESNEQSEYCANGCGENRSIYTIKTLNAEIEKLKAELKQVVMIGVEGQREINRKAHAEITKLTRQRDTMKKALEWRFKPMHFTSIIINDEAANMANSCLDELMKEALQEAEGVE